MTQNKLKQTYLLFLLSFVFFTSPLEAAPFLSVGEAQIRKPKLALVPLPSPSENQQTSLAPFVDGFQKTLRMDLEWVQFFELIPPTTSGASADFQLRFSAATPPETLDPHKNLIQFQGEVLDLAKGQTLLKKVYLGTKRDIKILAHTFANEFIEKTTALPGIFLTRIAMTCDFTGKKEIYTMAFDGTDVKQITQHRSLAFSPSWNANGTRLAYSLFTQTRGVKHIRLYELNFLNQTLRLLSHQPGINSGASYSPDGKSLALTLSGRGEPEIFKMDLSTQKLTSLTGGQKFSVEPSWSPSGEQIVFSSSRTGAPMLFTMNQDGSSQKRLTFAGRYNSTPSWSPQNNKIVFSGWLDQKFDLFIMNPDGTQMERLTGEEGSHEDPSFSPDGQWIAFSSDRGSQLKGKKQRNIYVIRVDGLHTKRLTYGPGNCTFPKWSPLFTPTPKLNSLKGPTYPPIEDPSKKSIKNSDGSTSNT